MTGHETRAGSQTPDRAIPVRPWTVVWIDSKEATIARWVDGRPRILRLQSDVPAHHRATGHVRHDPTNRHGGGGPPQTAGEPHRLEHLARFLDHVASRLPDQDDLAILGPGTVREHLETLVTDADAQHRRSRIVICEASKPLTDGQLVAKLRALVGLKPARRTVGAYRWTGRGPITRSGRITAPRRVLQKPPGGLPGESETVAAAPSPVAPAAAGATGRSEPGLR